MEGRTVPRKAFINKKKGYIVDRIKEPTALKFDRELWERLFGKRENLSRLQITDVARYSMANNMISNKLRETLVKHISLVLQCDLGKLTVTETNGGVGGFSIKLAEMFNKLNIVELSSTHANMIRNNLSHTSDSKTKKICIYNENYMDVMYDLKQDIIVSDPPWGGYSYANRSSFKLGFNNVNITHVINSLYKRGMFKLYVVFAMRNFDIQDFVNNIESPDILINNLGKHYFITVIGKDVLKKSD
jgi:predicted RNA methylase